MLKNLMLWLAIGGALALTYASNQVPTPLPANAPGAVFSAGRAMIDNRIIARVPHPIGSAENAAVRDYLVRRMTELGLNPQVQRHEVVRDDKFGAQTYVSVGTVENVIGVLPGRDRTAPALALMAHYDSVPGSPGAADDAAGTSAALEIIRALKTQGTPARDVIVLITDGEEVGLFGAEGFFAKTPMAKHVGMVLNMETRGGGGRVQMFQTGDQNGDLIKLFAKTAVRPVSSSLSVFLYELLPNDTDFTVSKRAGITGLNYAFIGKQFDYHSPTSTSDNLEQGSLQDMGDQVLSVAKPLAFDAALPGRAPNAVYSQTVGSHVIAYRSFVGWLVLALAAGLAAVGIVRARKRSALAWIDVAKGFGLALQLALLVAVVLRLARRATGAGMGFIEQRQLLAQVTRWEIALLLLGVGAMLYLAGSAGRGRGRGLTVVLSLAAGLLCSAFGLDTVGLGLGLGAAALALVTLGKPVEVAGAMVGYLTLVFLLALIAQAMAPATAFLLAWPLLIAGLIGAVTAMGDRTSSWRLWVAAGLAILGVSWVAGYADGVFLAMDQVEALAAFALLAMAMLWPLAHGATRWVAVGLMVAGCAVVALVRLDPPWSARHPQTTYVAYQRNVDANSYQRISLSSTLDPWTESVLKADGGTIAPQTLDSKFGPVPGQAALAKPVEIGAPTLTLAKLADGRLQLTMIPPRGSDEFQMDVRSKSRLTDATVNGEPVALTDTPDKWIQLRFAASPQGGVINFRAVGPGELDIRYSATINGWPEEAVPLPSRDPKLMPWDRSDSAMAVGTRRFSW